MNKNQYSDAATQVLDILNYTDIDDVNKIPKSFINFLKDIANKNYKVNFDHGKSLARIRFDKRSKRTFRVYIYYLVV